MTEIEGNLYDEKDTPVAFTIEGDRVAVTLTDGRIISNPLEWHAWLRNATPEQLSHVEYWSDAVYFPELDEGLDVEAMLKGAKAKTPVTGRTTAS
jgi:hypothetical protein